MDYLLSPFDGAPARLFLKRRYFLPRPGPYPDTSQSRSGHSSATIHSRSKTRCHPFEHSMPAFFAIAPRAMPNASGAKRCSRENACALGVGPMDRMPGSRVSAAIDRKSAGRRQSIARRAGRSGRRDRHGGAAMEMPNARRMPPAEANMPGTACIFGGRGVVSTLSNLNDLLSLLMQGSYAPQPLLPSRPA